MKQILFLIAVGFSTVTNAQQLKLNKGQKIQVISSVSQDMDVMGMQMQNKSSSTSLVEIKDADGKNYNAVYKLDKLTMSMDGMGQQQSYDSEKPEDKDSEIGKSVGASVGKEIKVTIDKTTGKAVSETPATDKKEEEEDNPLAGIMDMFGAKESETAITESVYFLIPAGKKTGDSWTDSTKASPTMTGFKTYTIKSIAGNVATIGLFSKLEGSQNVETQGMTMDVTISAKTEGEMLVDITNSLLKKSSRVADITGNMNMMGQSMPLTSKMTEFTEYK